MARRLNTRTFVPSYKLYTKNDHHHLNMLHFLQFGKIEHSLNNNVGNITGAGNTPYSSRQAFATFLDFD
jgi:hypothetical protein